MSNALTALGAAAAGAGGALIATPLAEWLARATEFLDHPGAHKRHAAATPYLGGLAVFGAVAVLGAAFGVWHGHLLAVVICALGMWAIGTADDRVGISGRWRLLAAAVAGVALYEAGAGWSVFGTRALDEPLTVVWVAGITIACNLMDNLDGACGSVATIAAAGIAAVAALAGSEYAAIAAALLAGTCAGFLRFNLTAPRARIFLGDGGSMSIGLLIAGLSIAAVGHHPGGSAPLLAGAMLAGMPILDTTLVSVSRRRRGVSLGTAGRDHLSHRLLAALGTPRRVALALATGQVLLSGLAVAGERCGEGVTIGLAVLACVLGAGVIAAMELADPRTRGARAADSAQPRPPGVRHTGSLESA